MIIWSSDLIELFCVFKAFASQNSQAVLIEMLTMTCVMQIRIPLKRALTKMWLGLVQKRSKYSYENIVGELKVCKIWTPESSIR